MNDKLKARMDEMGVNQADLCEALDISPPLMHYIVKRPKLAPMRCANLPEIHKKIARKLKCKVSEIF